MILALLLACTGGAKDAETGPAAEDSAAEDTAATEVPCSPWLPWDVPGATWEYVDADGNVAITQTAGGPVTWDHGTHASLVAEYWFDGAVVSTERSFLPCLDEGLAVAGGDGMVDGTRYVTQYVPSLLWMPRALAIGQSWSTASEAAMDGYDADGERVWRDRAPVTYEATVTGAETITVPAGTFDTLLVDFGGGVFAYAEGVGPVRMNGHDGELYLSGYTVP